MSNPAELPIHSFLRSRLADRYGGNLSKMGEACDATPTMMSKWVSEDPRKRTVPSPTSCVKIAKALYEDPDYVLSLAGHRDAEVKASSADPRWAAFIAQVEAGWQAADDKARELAERVILATFPVPPTTRTRRVTKSPRKFGRPNADAVQQPLTRKRYQSQSVATQISRYGFMPATT